MTASKILDSALRLLISSTVDPFRKVEVHVAPAVTRRLPNPPIDLLSLDERERDEKIIADCQKFLENVFGEPPLWIGATQDFALDAMIKRLPVVMESGLVAAIYRDKTFSTSLSLNFGNADTVDECLAALRLTSPVPFMVLGESTPTMGDTLSKPEYLNINRQLRLGFRTKEEFHEFGRVCRKIFVEIAR